MKIHIAIYVHNQSPLRVVLEGDEPGSLYAQYQAVKAGLEQYVEGAVKRELEAAFLESDDSHNG